MYLTLQALRKVCYLAATCAESPAFKPFFAVPNTCTACTLHVLACPQVSLAAGTEQLPEKLISLREALAGAAAAAAADGSGSGSSTSSSDEGSSSSSSGGANVSQLVARHPQLLRHDPQQLQALVQQVRPHCHAAKQSSRALAGTQASRDT
jgi:hypothetical protein